ncbi:MAG TPA: ATP-binding protein, partial [Dehalococcoidia bacterium]
MTILVQERALEDAAAGLARALSWFDSLLAAKVAAHRARLRDGDDFRGIFISEDEVDEILSRASLGDGSSGLNGSFEERLSPPLPDRLARLASEFGLNEFDVACLLMVVAYQLDRRYGRLFAYLQDDLTRQTPTAGLALELFCGSFQESAAARSRFAAAAPAVSLGLLRVDTAAGQPLMSRVLTPDERVVAFLLGVDDADEGLLGCGASLLPRPAPGLVVGARFHEETERLITRLRATETAPVLAIRGDKGSGRRLAARRIAAALGHDTLLLPWAADGDVSTAMREAVFQDAMLCWADADALLDAERPPRALELALEASQRVVIFTLGHVGHLPLRLAGRPVWVLDVPAPGNAERQAIWAQEGARAGVALTDLEAELLATTYRLNGGRIAAAADRALLRAGGRSVLPQDLLEAARSLSTTDLGRLGQEIRPRFGWADIVLPAEVSEALHEIIDRVVHHGRVFGDWGFDARHAASRSLSVLFCGPSGTGKTMAAEVIATELGLPLYRVDLSAVVSKYIGETEKNLSQIFSDAASSGAIL